MIINCIAVDDEPIALDIITSYIEKTPFLKLVKKSSGAIMAMQVLQEHPEVQLVFLDIRMADLSGMEMARLLSQSGALKDTKIIFTTAYDQYALEGYKVAALDYLLKPFSFADFTRAANRALEHFQALGHKEIPVQMDKPAEPAKQRDHIFLKVEYQLVKVNFDDILYLEGLKDYVKVYLKNEPRPILTHASMKSLEERLPAERFLRFHRSYIVALDKITSVTKTSVQIGKMIIPVTDQYRDVFQVFLDSWT
jgi:DNA-binding LytR/AlgR family response regulator